jgi:uncharacterized protein
MTDASRPTQPDATATSTIPVREVPTRRIAFDYPAHDDLPKYFMGDGDPVMSHVVAVLSGLFPPGEDFFVRSVRAYRNRVTDPELRRQVKGFIGQEATHGREHRALNERLAAHGYPTRGVDRFVSGMFALSERLPGRARRLAVTAALEHYTATLAEVLLTDERARDMFSVDEVRHLLLWHALEEAEHKSVAFDVFQTVSGNDRLRVIIMNLTTAGFIGVTLAWTGVSLATDSGTWRNPGRVLRGLAATRQSPWLTSAVWRRLRDYNRRDFHPDDHDSTELLAAWRDQLFGDDGQLRDLLGAQPAA